MAYEDVWKRKGTLTSPFLCIPIEIRILIYKDIFSTRSIVLRDKLKSHRTRGRRFQYFLQNADETSDSTVTVLLLCKQTCNEAKTLLANYTPSHLIFSKYLHRIPKVFSRNDPEEYTSLLKYVAKLSINAEGLGDNRDINKDCPGWYTCRFGLDEFPDYTGSAGPGRVPNLKEIYLLSEILGSMPSLRELHIYDVLKHSLHSRQDICSCRIAGTASCNCGSCKCVCVPSPPLPNSPTMAVAETRTKLHETMLARYRNSLVADDRSFFKEFSDYLTVLDLLRRGVHIFVCDDVVLTVPSDDGKVLHKGHWRASYHLSPPTGAASPPDVPTDTLESPRRCNIKEKRAKEEEEKNFVLNSGQGFEETDPGFLPPPSPTDSGLSVLTNFDFDSFLDENASKPAEFADKQIRRPLQEFEAELTLELVDESIFDKLLKQEPENDLLAMGTRESNNNFWRWS